MDMALNVHTSDAVASSTLSCGVYKLYLIPSFLKILHLYYTKAGRIPSFVGPSTVYIKDIIFSLSFILPNKLPNGAISREKSFSAANMFDIQ